ncbi:S-layer homology domain-containing protein [Paenibacillus sp. 2TAB19]|uniref:S-layer homology domain-containing protein n=1 Tax=Paenibacillus sp. 2TAB19 TaxID=3233003 RepID=UPI003F9B1F8F
MNPENPKLKRFISATLAFLLMFNVSFFLNGQEAHAAATNLALNKPVTVSGTFSSYVGSNAVDGVNGTFWSQNNTTTGGHLTVDLGAPTTFNAWEIYRGWYIMGIELQISTNGVNFTPINDPNASATMTPTSYYDSGLKPLSSPVTARYVRLVISANYDNYFRIYEFKLYNILAPSAPLNVSAEGGVNQAKVYFTPPADDGGAAITKYTVTSSPGNITASGTSSPITVPSLPVGDYTFTVKATNIGATGSSSTDSNSVAVTAPASPEATPTAGIDYATEQLTGLVANDAYSINGTAVTADGSGKVAIDGSWLGVAVNVVKKGNGTSTTDSTAQTVSLPSRPAMPAAGKTDETSISGNNGTLTNVTSAMEYKKGAAGSWTSVTGTSVTRLAPDTYSVRFKATSSAFASVAQTLTIAAFIGSPETTPEAVIDYAAEQLTGLVANGAYTINGTAVTANGSGKVAIDDSWLGVIVNVVKKGDGTTTADSEAQTVSLPSRPATPAAEKTDETFISGNNGTLTNVTSAMEYKKGTAGSWTSVTGTSITELAPDTYYVRVKATSSAFASDAQSVTIAAFISPPETTPEAVIDYAAEQLTGLVPNAAYSINGTAVTADGSGKVEIDGSWLGEIVNVVKKGNGTTTADSTAQTLSLPSRPAAPVDITVTDITYNGANDGSILNVNPTMEFKIGNAETWTNITESSVVGLAPGDYYVRVAATESAFASIPAQATIHDTDATIPGEPNVSADDAGNVIIGLDTTMEISVDGEAYVRYDGTNMPQLSGEHTVQVRVAASGSIPAGPPATLIFTTNASVPAGGLTVTAIDPRGAANDGKTRITVTPATDGENSLVYFNFGSGIVDVPNVGDTRSSYLNVPSDRLIPAANGDKIGVAEVDAQGQVVKFGHTTARVIAEQSVTPPTNEASTGPNEESIDVLVNGKVENAGKATTTESGGVKTTTVVVDPAKLQSKLDAEGVNAVVTIPVKSKSNVIVGELNGQMVKNMENLLATLVLQTDKGSYTLPAKEINIDELAGKLGSNVKLEDIQLKVTVAQTPDTMAKVVESAASEGEFSVVVPAVDFTVTATYGGKTVEVTAYNVYVERMVALPDGIDPNRITTGVVVDPDGTVRHVPTQIVMIDGKSYAIIKSLTNSTYAVVWHPIAFADVEKHWAKEAVNDMGARLVIHGVNETSFNPDADITRAEFAAMIVRGLGLRLGEASQSFSDVATDAWYASAIQTALDYGLVSGYEDGTFQPNAKITREQAMVIIAKAMKLTGLAKVTGVPDKDAVLGKFADSANMGTWATDSIALAAEAGLISGRSNGKLEAKANVTRAEVATLIQRLLKQSDLI